ncbi:MAG: hypothetical protein H7831_07265 [Magnetococcus sp. WYHC-3]
MLWKILLPLLAVGAIYFTGRVHAARARPPGPTEPDAEPGLSAMVRRVALALVLCGVGLAGWFYYDYWRDTHLVVRVRVINTQSGAAQSFDAYQGQVHQRSFVTLDGRHINLSDIERMEIQPAMP